MPAVRRPAPKRKPRRKGKPGFVVAPPWAPLPRDIHKLWVLGLSGAVSYLATLFSLVEAFTPRRASAPVDVEWLVVAGVGLVFALLALGAFMKQRWRADPTARFFDWVAWEEREGRAGRAARKARPAKQADPTYWMHRLTDRLARLKRLEELDAPHIIIEKEKELVRAAIAELEPSQALSVMQSLPGMAAQFDPELRPDTPPDKSN
jgi:hypothetical protein